MNTQKKTTHRIIRTLMLTMACAPMMAYPLQKAGAVGLKENSTVSDNTIKLGDVFYGLPRDEERVLGIAPRPGEDMVLTAKTLLRIALAMDLPWRPSGSGDQVVLRRAATIIPREHIEKSVMDALSRSGVTGDFGIILPAQYGRIILPADQPADMEITNVKLDPERKSFTADIYAPSRDNPVQHFEISGAVQAKINIPVLKENISNGRIIHAGDIEMISILETEYTTDTIMDTQDIIGMTARRAIIAGRPIHESDMIAPKIVHRGEVVTLTLNDGVLNISTTAKALENGTKGDLIRVVNTSSNQTVQAMVTGEKEVKVLSH